MLTAAKDNRLVIAGTPPQDALLAKERPPPAADLRLLLGQEPLPSMATAQLRAKQAAAASAIRARRQEMQASLASTIAGVLSERSPRAAEVAQTDDMGGLRSTARVARLDPRDAEASASIRRWLAVQRSARTGSASPASPATAARVSSPSPSGRGRGTSVASSLEGRGRSASRKAANRDVAATSPSEGIGMSSAAARARLIRQAEEDGAALTRAAASRHEAPSRGGARRADTPKVRAPRFRLGADHNRTSWLGAQAAASIAMEQDCLSGRLRVAKGELRVRGGTPPRARRAQAAVQRGRTRHRRAAAQAPEGEDSARPGSVPRPTGAALALAAASGASSAAGAPVRRRETVSCSPTQPAGARSSAAGSASTPSRPQPRPSTRGAGAARRSPDTRRRDLVPDTAAVPAAVQQEAARREALRAAMLAQRSEQRRSLAEAERLSKEATAATAALDGSRPLSLPLPSAGVSIGKEDRFAAGDKLFLSRGHCAGQSSSVTANATISGTDGGLTGSNAHSRLLGPASAMRSRAPRFVPLTRAGCDSPGSGYYSPQQQPGAFPAAPYGAEDLPSVPVAPHPRRGASPRGGWAHRKGSPHTAATEHKGSEGENDDDCVAAAAAAVDAIRRGAASKVHRNGKPVGASTPQPAKAEQQKTQGAVTLRATATASSAASAAIEVARRQGRLAVERELKRRQAAAAGARSRAQAAAAARRAQEQRERQATPDGRGQGDGKWAERRRETRRPWRRGEDAEHEARVATLEEQLAALDAAAGARRAGREDASTVDSSFFREANSRPVTRPGGVRNGIRPVKGSRAPLGFGSSAVRPLKSRTRTAVVASPSPLDYASSAPRRSPGPVSMPTATRAQRARVLDATLHKVDPAGAAAAQAAAESDMDNWTPANLLGSASDALVRPGPASYSPAAADNAVRPRGPSSTFGGAGTGVARTRVTPSPTPGPGAYASGPERADADLRATRASSPAARFSSSARTAPLDTELRLRASRGIPGPAYYFVSAGPLPAPEDDAPLPTPGPSPHRPGKAAPPARLTAASGAVSPITRPVPRRPVSTPSGDRLSQPKRPASLSPRAVASIQRGPTLAWSGPPGGGQAVSAARRAYAVPSSPGQGRLAQSLPVRGGRTFVARGSGRISDTGFRPATAQPTVSLIGGDIGTRSHVSNQRDSPAPSFSRGPRFHQAEYSPLNARLL